MKGKIFVKNPRREQRIFASSQNLNVDEADKPLGSMFWSGRAWLFFPRTTLQVEWHFGSRANATHILLNVDLVGARQITLSLALNRLFYLTLFFQSGRLPSRNIDHGERTIGLSIFDGCLWFYLWGDRTGWGPDRTKCLHVLDSLLGRPSYSERNIRKGRTRIILPEADYPAAYRLFEATRARPFWPWPARWNSVELKLEVPIPIPGKGENDWDLEDGAVFSSIGPANSPEAAARELASSVLRRRRRYGGYNC